MSEAYPRPFYHDPWSGERADAAAAIWDWHTALRTGATESSGLEKEDFVLEAERVRVEMTTRLVDDDISARARTAAVALSLDPNLFAVQVEAAYVYSKQASFSDYASLQRFAERWAAPVGRLLLGVAGSNRDWQIPWTDALSRGFFYLGRLLHLAADVHANRIFLPRDEMAFFGVSESDLRRGPPREHVRKLLWKQCVRIRDQFAQALPLASELPRKQASAFRKWWLGGLEMVNAIERNEYDVWTAPIRLSRFHRAQVHYQSRFGRLVFKSK